MTATTENEEPTPAEVEEPAPEAVEEPAVEEPEEDKADPDMPPVQSVEHAKNILECLFFTTTQPITPKRLRGLLGPLNQEQIDEAIELLRKDCEERGLHVKQVAGGYALATKSEYADWVLKLNRQRRRRSLTKTMLETLAIVAYRQPIIKSEIDSIRGVDSGGVLRTLVDMDLIDARDRREVIGRPLQYRTTKSFLKAFSLKSLNELPTIGELRDLYGATTKEPRQAPEEEVQVEESAEAATEAPEVEEEETPVEQD